MPPHHTAIYRFLNNLAAQGYTLCRVPEDMYTSAGDYLPTNRTTADLIELAEQLGPLVDPVNPDQLVKLPEASPPFPNFVPSLPPIFRQFYADCFNRIAKSLGCTQR